MELLLERIAADETLPALARELFGFHGREYGQLQEQLKEIDAKLIAWHRADECSLRLAQIPGVGPIGASMLPRHAQRVLHDRLVKFALEKAVLSRSGAISRDTTSHCELGFAAGCLFRRYTLRISGGNNVR